MIRLLQLLILLAAVGAAPGVLHSQEVRVEGGERFPAVRLMRQILADGQYLLLQRDTILPADFHTTGDVLVVDADVRLEGQVEGRVAVADGVLFVRPGGRIAGPIASVGGAVYPSGLSDVGEIVETPAGTRVEITTLGEGFLVRIEAPPAPRPVVLPGALGLRLPTYDRVDGLTVRWGPQWRIVRPPDGPTLDPWLAYRSARGKVDGGILLAVPLGGGVQVTAEAARSTLTNEAWIRGDLANTLAALFLGSDYRDYYQSDYAALTLRRSPAAGPSAPALAAAPRLTLLASRDRSLSTADPWSLFGGEGMRRPNFPIDEGRVLSVTAGAELSWRGGNSTFSGDASVEHAISGGERLDFTRWLVHGRWTLDALWDHQVSLFARGMGPAANGPLPRQRWSFVGGVGTLPTFALGEFRGDHLVFIESIYAAPLGFAELPFVGAPILRAIHAAGMAWPSGTPMPAWEQNVGLGLRLLVLDAAVFVDPARAEVRPVLSVGLVLPF